jgi:protein gp37
MDSMSDMFHRDVLDLAPEWLDKIFTTMALCPQHKFIVLTKRIENAMEYLKKEKPTPFHLYDGYRFLSALPSGNLGNARCSGIWPLPNVQLLVSIWDQASADAAVPVLLDTPAAVRGVSIEPMLGPILIPDKYLMSCIGCGNQGSTAMCMNRPGSGHDLCHACDKGEEGAPSLDRVILGGENGPGARPMHPDWVRSVRDQCEDAGVPFWFKGWGDGMRQAEWYVSARRAGWNSDAKHGGHILDGREWRQAR